MSDEVTDIGSPLGLAPNPTDAPDHYTAPPNPADVSDHNTAPPGSAIPREPGYSVTYCGLHMGNNSDYDELFEDSEFGPGLINQEETGGFFNSQGTIVVEDEPVRFGNEPDSSNKLAADNEPDSSNKLAAGNQPDKATTHGWQNALLRNTGFYSLNEYYNSRFKALGVGRRIPLVFPLFPLNDIGIASLFREVHGGIITVVKETGDYRVFDGIRFRADAGLIAEICKSFVTALATYATGKDVCATDTLVPKGKGYMSFQEFAASFYRLGKRKSLLADASTLQRVSVEAFDAKPYLFNCLNGTFDLSTMEFREHRPEDLLTMVSRVTHDENAVFPRWPQFIDEVMGYDKEKVAYLQKLMGYCLSGDRSQRCLAIMYGPSSSNGKSTLLVSLEHLFDEYAKTAQPQTFAKCNTKGSTPSPDIARLKGSRLVNVPEPSKGFEVNEAFVKQITGGDPVTTRFLRGNPFQFTPEFFIVIATNHMLQISDQSVIDSKRMKIINFNRCFIGNPDMSLKQAFRSPEAISAIFNWLVEGYRQYKADGHLTPPDELKSELEAFKLEAIGQLDEFLASNLEVKPAEKTKVSDIHKRHTEWATESGLKRLSKHTFLPALRERYGAAVDRDAIKGNVLKGYALKTLTSDTNKATDEVNS